MAVMSLSGGNDEFELCIRNEAAADDPSRKFRPVAHERRTDRCERCRLDELGRMLLQIRVIGDFGRPILVDRSEEHTSELQSLVRISYAVFCLKKKILPHRHSPLFCTIVLQL